MEVTATTHLGRVLVTGGTGTFGRAFRAHVLEHDLVDELVVLSRDELKQAEQRERCPDPRVRWFLGDVRDRARLRRAFAGCDVVVHAAALKRLEACRYNPNEAVDTNVGGTRNAVEAALDAGVGRFLLISTDKACAPVNLYGATKAVAERLTCAANAYVGDRDQRFGAVRYGNVFGSRGSVLGRWRALAEAGEPLPLTSRAATRFWMTVEQAVAFVLEALAHLRGGTAGPEACPSGEVHVPHLPAVRMRDVAEAVLRRTMPRHVPECGTKVRGCWSTCPKAEWDEAHERDANGDDGLWDDRIEVTGLTPGEKRHEALIERDELRRAYRVDRGGWQGGNRGDEERGTRPCWRGGRYVLTDHPRPGWLELCEAAAVLEWEPYRSDGTHWTLSPEEVTRMVGEATT